MRPTQLYLFQEPEKGQIHTELQEQHETWQAEWWKYRELIRDIVHSADDADMSSDKLIEVAVLVTTRYRRGEVPKGLSHFLRLFETAVSRS